MCSRSRRLGLEVVLRPIKALASVCLGLGIKGLDLGIGIGQLGLMHIPC